MLIPSNVTPFDGAASAFNACINAMVVLMKINTAVQ